MGCNCNNNIQNNGCNCQKCNAYCNMCAPIYNPTIEYFSDKYHNLENNYPVKKCLCNPFGINPKYYSPVHVPCNCRDKCYPC